MDKNFEKYVSEQPSERRRLLRNIHAVIIKEDISVIPVITKMMGKEMVVYNAKGSMKYALSSVKKYMSLHVLPIYGSKILFDKYCALLPNANFQKGCINFNEEEEIPLKVIKQLIADCAPIDLVAIREKYLAEKKLKAGKK